MFDFLSLHLARGNDVFYPMKSFHSWDGSTQVESYGACELKSNSAPCYQLSFRSQKQLPRKRITSLFERILLHDANTVWNSHDSTRNTAYTTWKDGWGSHAFESLICFQQRKCGKIPCLPTSCMRITARKLSFLEKNRERFKKLSLFWSTRRFSSTMESTGSRSVMKYLYVSRSTGGLQSTLVEASKSRFLALFLYWSE